MSSVACRISAPWITAMGAGDDVSFKPVRSHIESCLRCQAGVARQRRVRRGLEGLGDVAEVAPITRIHVDSAPDSRHGRQAFVGAVGAAIVVGVGVAGLRRALAD